MKTVLQQAEYERTDGTKDWLAIVDTTVAEFKRQGWPLRDLVLREEAEEIIKALAESLQEFMKYAAKNPHAPVSAFDKGNEALDKAGYGKQRSE